MLLAGGLAGGLTVLVILPSFWPMSALAGVLAAIALWGLLAHRMVARPSVVLALTQKFLVVIGSVFAIAALIATWYALLGPRWML